MKSLKPCFIVFVCFIAFSPWAWANQGADGSETGAASPGKKETKIFLKGYENFVDKDYSDAAPFFNHYISSTSYDAKDHDWAEFFLGICLSRLGYTHGAAEVFSNLVVRKPNPKIVEYSLEILEKITRSKPFDDELILDHALCDEEYGFVQSEKLVDFINYYQGSYDWKHGFPDWADKHFAKIKKDSYYYYKYLYQKTLLFVYKNDVDHAIGILQEIIENMTPQDETLVDESRKTLARLLYEKGRYEEADQLYREIEENIIFQSRNLLERAWIYFQEGNPEKAMGLLYAFESPRFKNYFTPEYYVLKSFIYKDVCNYTNAKSVVDKFKDRYGEAISGIYKREKIENNDTLLLLLMNKRKIKKTLDFLNLLEDEKTKAKEFKNEKELSGFLNRIYELEIDKQKAELKKQIDVEYEKMANDLLAYEEEADLISYEIGLDMYQRVNNYHYKDAEKEDTIENKDMADAVIYPFQGEFWNDELADYKVVLSDKCKKMEEWDIYFK